MRMLFKNYLENNLGKSEVPNQFLDGSTMRV